MDGSSKSLQATSYLRTLSEVVQRLSLAARLGKGHSGARDYYNVLGYKKNLTFNDYYSRYDRQDIAGRIVGAVARTTWRNPPDVWETEDNEEETQFEREWKSLLKKHRLWHYLHRVDRLSGVGQYGILLLGFRGAGPLSEPINENQFNGAKDLLYLSVYHQGSVKIKNWVSDPEDERFGLPLTYEVTLGGADLQGAGFERRTESVHYSRVIHVAEEFDEDEVFGRPRLHRVYNLLDDLQKVVGSSAEMFWQGAYRGPAVSTREGYELGNNADEVSKHVEEYIHGLRRFMRLEGLDVEFPTGQVPDPSQIFDVLMTLISSVTNIPKRILMGSERGELASSQDEDNWLGLIAERQVHHAEPMILRPLIDRLIWAGVLPPLTVQEDYTVDWPNLFVLSEKEKAEVNKIRAETAVALAPDGKVDLLIPREEARSKFLELDEEPEQGLPEFRQRELEEFKLEQELDITSRKEMLRQLGLSDADIEKRLQEIEDEKSLAGFGLDRLIQGLPGGPTDDDEEEETPPGSED